MSSTGSDNPTIAAPPSCEPAGAELEHVDCALVVVTYNSARHIERLLDSVPASTEGLRTRCIVVDNASSDETVEIVRARPEVVIVEAGGNLGYAGAFNLGRAHAGPSASLLILNPDLILERGTIARLYEAIQEPGVGLAVPLLLNEDGSVYPTLRREPSLSRAFGDALCGSRFPTRPGWLSETVRDNGSYENLRNVDWASGAVMLISAACDEAVGSWDDERFFLYSEETDFATRARRCGYQVRYVPHASARHEAGGSGRSPALNALLAVNRVRYYEKYHRRPASSLFRGTVTLHYLLRAADPDNRAALKALSRRSRWTRLPGGGRAAREQIRP